MDKNKPKETRPSTFNAELYEWVTSGVFQMTLTKRQIAFLAAAYANDRSLAETRQEGKPSRFVATIKELEVRGLLNHLNRLGDVQKIARAEGWQHFGDWIINQEFNRVYVLTKAGRLMCELLKEANLLDPELKEGSPFYMPQKPRKPKGYRRQIAEHFARQEATPNQIKGP